MTHIPGYMLERRFIVGTLALDSNADIAEKARQVLGLDESVTDCARFTAEFRQLLGGLSDQSLDSPAGASSSSSD